MSDGINDAMDEMASGGETIQCPPQMVYGVSVFQMQDDHPIVHVTGTPDLGQLQRLLGAALMNLQADIVARKVVDHLERRQNQSRIIRPGG